MFGDIGNTFLVRSGAEHILRTIYISTHPIPGPSPLREGKGVCATDGMGCLKKSATLYLLTKTTSGIQNPEVVICYVVRL